MVVFLLLAFSYLALTQKYRAYDIDNPWFLSFSYNHCHNGPSSDTFMQIRYPGGMDGVHLFGKLAAQSQCTVLNHTAWTAPWIIRVNTLFTLLSLALLWSSLRRLNLHERWIAGFILLLGFTEPIVSMVQKARYEVFAFLLLTLALRLGVQGWEFSAALVAMLAVEIEPAAIVVPAAVVIVLAIRSTQRRRLAFKLLGAAATAAALYALLHPGAIPEMLHSHYPHTSVSFGGSFRAYFLERHRHLPELFMLALGFGLYFKHYRSIAAQSRQRAHIVVACAALMLLFLLSGLHPNASYMAFAMPFLLWLALEGFAAAPKLRWIPALVFAGFIAQYAWLFSVNLHEGFRAQDYAAVRQQIAATAASLNLRDSQLHLCGDYALWFAHPDRYTACSPTRPDDIHQSNLFLCFDGPLMPHDLSAETASCASLNAITPLRELSTLDLRGHQLHIEVPR